MDGLVKHPLPPHLERGERGELAAKEELIRTGMRHLASNYRHRRGEIDLIFEDQNCLVFVEVKTRSPGGWLRPAAAVNRRKRKLLSKTALAYLRKLRRPRTAFRFDVVEVIMDGDSIAEIRHLKNAFPLDAAYRYG